MIKGLGASTSAGSGRAYEVASGRGRSGKVGHARCGDTNSKSGASFNIACARQASILASQAKL
eukprot:6207970-Pleurochrysis_carterae.AAC.1